VLYSNVDGFLNKKDEFFARIQDIEPNIIALTEIKPKNLHTFNETEFHIPNYDMFLNRNHKRGVALYTDKSLNAQECQDLNETEFQESVWCTFNTAEGKVLLGCIYRSPNTSSEENDAKLFQLLKSDTVASYDKVCVVGDFNYPQVRWDGVWSGERSDLILQHVQDAYLIQKVDTPTRRRSGQNPTLDDWVLVSEDSLVSDITHLDPVGKSDHDVLSFKLYVSTVNTVKDKVRYVYSFNKGNYDKLRDIVRDHDWTVMAEMDVEQSWNHLKDVLQVGMEQSIPKVKTGNKRNNRPIWMNKKMLRLVKKKYNLFKRYLRTRSALDYRNYIKARNSCTKLLRNCRKNYEKEIAREGKSNPKKFWKYVQERMKINTGISALKRDDESLAVTDLEKAETLNKFFSSVFTREDTSNVPQMDECSCSKGMSLCDIRVTPTLVKNKLKELNPNKSQGPDLIPPRVLKEVSEVLADPLCCIFNKSLESGTLPEDWKTAEVTALFKKGTKTDPGNYRPVSLTCIACKVLESVVRDAMVSHFTDHNLYAECQHGFRKGRSCVTQLLEVIENLTLFMDNGEPIDIIYLDFKKAFDSVPHERLLTKLSAYGVCGNTLNWIRNFLTGRSQHVRVGSERSEKTSVLSGIPQGSILGPILFTVFINDLPESVQSVIKVFADDTKLYNIASNSTVIQVDINKLQDWSELWNLYFNVAKCHVMHMGKKNENYEYTMKMKDDVIVINTCEEEKDLGVTFDANLSFDPHILRVVNKANQMVGIIRRAFTFLDRDTFLKLFKAFIRPHLEYASVVWCPYLKRQSVMIEKVQRRATKLLTECHNMTYEERLKYLNLHSLKGRRIRGDLIQMFKIFHGIVDVDVHSLFTFSHTNITRNSEGKVFIKQCNTNKRKFSFACRVANNWNALPANTKFAPNVNSFKSLLEKDSKLLELFFGFD